MRNAAFAKLLNVALTDSVVPVIQAAVNSG